MGNMALQAGANRDLGKAEYTLKRAMYKQTMTRKLGGEIQIGHLSIAAHQNWMANQAQAIWRIAPMS